MAQLAFKKNKNTSWNLQKSYPLGTIWTADCHLRVPNFKLSTKIFWKDPTFQSIPTNFSLNIQLGCWATTLQTLGLAASGQEFWLHDPLGAAWDWNKNASGNRWETDGDSDIRKPIWSIYVDLYIVDMGFISWSLRKSSSKVYLWSWNPHH